MYQIVIRYQWYEFKFHAMCPYPLSLYVYTHIHVQCTHFPLTGTFSVCTCTYLIHVPYVNMLHCEAVASLPIMVCEWGVLLRTSSDDSFPTQEERACDMVLYTLY